MTVVISIHTLNDNESVNQNWNSETLLMPTSSFSTSMRASERWVGSTRRKQKGSSSCENDPYFPSWTELYLTTFTRCNYVTPTSYLELILTFKSLLKGKRDDILNLKTRYEMGLGKLEFASSQAKLTITILDTLTLTSIISGDCDAKRAHRPPPPTAGDKRRDREVDDQDRAGHYSGRMMMIKMKLSTSFGGCHFHNIFQ